MCPARLLKKSSRCLPKTPACIIRRSISNFRSTESVSAGYGRIEVGVNIGEIAEAAYQYGRTAEGSTENEILKARYEAVMALQTTPKYFQTAITLSKDKVSELVHDVLDPMVTELKEASVTGFDVENKVFVFEDSQEGVTLGIEEAIKRVKEALDNGEYVKTITVSRSVQQPQVSKEFLSSQLGLISSTTTSTKMIRTET